MFLPGHAWFPWDAGGDDYDLCADEGGLQLVSSNEPSGHSPDHQSSGLNEVIEGVNNWDQTIFGADVINEGCLFVMFNFKFCIRERLSEGKYSLVLLSSLEILVMHFLCESK